MNRLSPRTGIGAQAIARSSRLNFCRRTPALPNDLKMTTEAITTTQINSSTLPFGKFPSIIVTDSTIQTSAQIEGHAAWIAA